MPWNEYIAFISPYLLSSCGLHGCIAKKPSLHSFYMEEIFVAKHNYEKLILLYDKMHAQIEQEQFV